MHVWARWENEPERGEEGERLTTAAILSLISVRAETIRGNGEGQGRGGSLGKMGTRPLRRWNGGVGAGRTFSAELMKHRWRWIMGSSRGWAGVFVRYSKTWFLWRNMLRGRKALLLKGYHCLHCRRQTAGTNAAKPMLLPCDRCYKYMPVGFIKTSSWHCKLTDVEKIRLPGLRRKESAV